MNEQVLISDIFRQEFAKMVAVISKSFGLQHIELAEDIVSETFLTATENWKEKGTPAQPIAWLYAVARQKILYHFRRKKILDEKIMPAIKSEQDQSYEENIDFSTENIRDSRLQMMFAVCDPAIASEAQIALALRILCGFGIDEIAEAFLTNKEAVNKRLFRAKKKLRTEKMRLEMPSEKEMNKRLDTVLHIIYLLFNEGYYSATQNQILRKELCLEALQLGLLLAEYDKTNLPKTNALIALMCFHTSRFDARQNDAGHFILYEQQDEALWNKELIAQGKYFLQAAASGSDISSYHLEAGIAFLHCVKEETEEKWQHILQHYDLLLQINYSPVVALNRLYALYKVKGKVTALKEAEQLQLTNNHFYFTLLGELYSGMDNNKAKECFKTAISLARTATEKQSIGEKLGALEFCV
ncbi:sigma-70 family RNA polymerase sigma factor [Ilyomonas limi]|uniref:Sigma-70 family RNA polymerase sigma factor n=1 Tax=Ilyomonas limi TaxID=2575867 RepID=A0A4U3L2I8_9BACT|nr:sigma-70 family RNA polymerase sigma factor [Ilyomonas limi]TKK69235.1 sigma-70 family RNA polymerase sigma factor [Ilyomonas limi]